MRNWLYHCSTETDELHNTRHERLIVHAATMPTSVLPAPHGSTMIPERARWLENIRLSERSCSGRGVRVEGAGRGCGPGL